MSKLPVSDLTSIWLGVHKLSRNIQEKHLVQINHLPFFNHARELSNLLQYGLIKEGGG